MVTDIVIDRDEGASDMHQRPAMVRRCFDHEPENDEAEAENENENEANGEAAIATLPRRLRQPPRSPKAPPATMEEARAQVQGLSEIGFGDGGRESRSETQLEVGTTSPALATFTPREPAA